MYAFTDIIFPAWRKDWELGTLEDRARVIGMRVWFCTRLGTIKDAFGSMPARGEVCVALAVACAPHSTDRLGAITEVDIEEAFNRLSHPPGIPPHSCTVFRCAPRS